MELLCALEDQTQGKPAPGVAPVVQSVHNTKHTKVHLNRNGHHDLSVPSYLFVPLPNSLGALTRIPLPWHFCTQLPTAPEALPSCGQPWPMSPPGHSPFKALELGSVTCATPRRNLLPLSHTEPSAEFSKCRFRDPEGSAPTPGPAKGPEMDMERLQWQG